jgi:hypothetical protein
MKKALTSSAFRKSMASSKPILILEIGRLKTDETR